MCDIYRVKIIVCDKDRRIQELTKVIKFGCVIIQYGRPVDVWLHPDKD